MMLKSKFFRYFNLCLLLITFCRIFPVFEPAFGNNLDLDPKGKKLKPLIKKTEKYSDAKTKEIGPGKRLINRVREYDRKNSGILSFIPGGNPKNIDKIIDLFCQVLIGVLIYLIIFKK